MRKQAVRRGAAVILGLSLVIALPGFDGISANVCAAEEKAAVTIQIDPENHSVFHDTDQDGWGEFQGWGTSLCWWANRIGYDETLTSQAAKIFFNAETGLGMSIGRYNIGGGDDLTTHESHITRSDSVVPGYAVDITPIDSQEAAQGFDQYDLECGYAWNYDWDADRNQLNVLKAALDEAGDGFIAETFSNSPPAFMTNSGCTSGGVDGAENLRKDCVTAFAKYLTDVTKHLIEQGFPIESMEGMNEPDSNWSFGSPKQEGCVIHPGELQSSVITALRRQMAEQGLNGVQLTAGDEPSTNQACNNYQKLSQEAKDALDRIDTHAYSVNKPADLRVLSERERKTLWMSEMDGTTVTGASGGEMRAALGLGQNISTQVNSLLPAAWILWDAIDIHVDRENPYDRDSLEEIGYDSLDQNGFWGLAVADHNEKKIYLTKKYYAYGQYSRYIRPGYTLLTTPGDHVAAYDKKTGTFVLVLHHKAAKNQTFHIDLQRFGEIAPDATMQVIRTSGSLKEGENWADLSEQGTAVLDTEHHQLVADVIGNSLTTYVIHGISLQEEQKRQVISVPENLPQDSVVKDTFPDLFDGSFVSGYHRTKKLEEIIVDLGKDYDLQGVAFAAYPKAEDSIEGGYIETSRDGVHWTELYQINRLATGYYFNYIDRSQYNNAEASLGRYIRFRDDDNYVALTEVRFYEEPKEDVTISPTPDIPVVKATEAPSGTGKPVVTEQPDSRKNSNVRKLKQVKVKSVRSKKKKAVTIRWNKVEGAKGYRITCAWNKNFRKGRKTVRTKATSMTIRKLKSGKKYYFKVEAYRGKIFGKASRVKSVRVK